jgi:hypothetical protein
MAAFFSTDFERRMRHGKRLGPCPHRAPRITLYYMAVVTVRLEPELEKQLSQVSRKQHRSRSDIIRDALRRQLALIRFEEVRRSSNPWPKPLAT